MPPKRISATAFAVALAVTACSGGGSSSAGHPSTKRSTTELARASSKLALGRAELVSPHQVLGPLDPATSDAVVAVVQRFVRVASSVPLASGGVARTGRRFSALFTPDAATRAAREDRAALVDDSLPPFGAIKPTAARVALTGLAGPSSPTAAFVVARLVWDVRSVDHPGDRVVRTGELSLIPVGGTWKIAAYDVVVKRTIDGVTTTTTAKSR